MDNNNCNYRMRKDLISKYNRLCILGEKILYFKTILEFSEGALFPSHIFFFPSEDTFDIAHVAEFPGLDRNGHLHQERENKKADCPDPKGYHQF